LAASNVSVGRCIGGTVLPIYESLRENIEEDEVIPMMIYLTADVVASLFVYLAALIRPE
jgi:hypothetical protein